MRIHKEGYRSLTIVLIFLVMINLTVWRYIHYSVILWVLLAISMVFFILILQFFRDPQRKIKTLDPSLLYAPADGKVVVIEEAVEAEYFKDKRLMISIFMSPLNVHINHHPVSGKILYKKYHPGKYLVAWHPKSSTENERTTVVYDTGKSTFLVRQIAGAVARRIVNYAKEGEQVIQGDQLGFIKFGSRVDIFLPLGTDYSVRLGQQVKSNVDIIARL